MVGEDARWDKEGGARREITCVFWKIGLGRCVCVRACAQTSEQSEACLVHFIQLLNKDLSSAADIVTDTYLLLLQ